MIYFNWSSLILTFQKWDIRHLWRWWLKVTSGHYSCCSNPQTVSYNRRTSTNNRETMDCYTNINIILSKNKLCEKSPISRFLFKKKNSTFHIAFYIAFVSYSILFEIFTINANLWKKFILKFLININKFFYILNSTSFSDNFDICNILNIVRIII